ncbi:putative lipid II flippase FtsW [candidate division FCPU426 bacterium]|nr:putative lipid II flippase FtsW [candidate division FCPU426 bacterium]
MSSARGQQGNIDVSLLTVTAVLISLGLIMVYSSSTILAMKEFGDSYFFIKRQLLWAFFGLLGLWAMACYPYQELKKWVKPAIVLCAVLLVAVLILSIGKTVGGARRWLSLGPVSFQPAELLKVVLVAYLAETLSRREKVMTSFVQGLLPHLLVLGAAAALLLCQPDLGTAVILIAVGCTMIYLAGARFSHLLSLGLAALPVAFALVYQVDYRRRRLDAFFDPWQEPLGKGFQVIQSFLALGSGGLWGRGLCESQQKLFYLPAPHTDFIFSILGEELGFVGAFGLLLLFSFILWKGFAIARRCEDRFGKLLAAGLTLLLGAQAFINIGVATGMMPTKGTTLPFISAGGSSLFFSLLAMGILLSISRHHPEEEA